MSLVQCVKTFLIKIKSVKQKNKLLYESTICPDITNEPRDACAAAIMASAFYELQGYSVNKKQYKEIADRILNSLIEHYRSSINSNHGFILLHSTGHKPANSEVDTPIIYADYYFLEAMLRKKKLR